MHKRREIILSRWVCDLNNVKKNDYTSMVV